MELQDAFYLVAIVFMTLLILIMAVLVVVLFIIKKRISEFVEKVKDMVAHPTETATRIIKRGLRV